MHTLCSQPAEPGNLSTGSQPLQLLDPNHVQILWGGLSRGWIPSSKKGFQSHLYEHPQCPTESVCCCHREKGNGHNQTALTLCTRQQNHEHDLGSHSKVQGWPFPNSVNDPLKDFKSLNANEPEAGASSCCLHLDSSYLQSAQAAPCSS